ncbi:MAG: hypothetical protein HC895_12205, partial [Leptolyngbyaceae cyanobacterium SM1_3_5]|nr:hypothetical protein [Leptolyngbyaceae cyanobacterium SM1_3_5]
AFHPHLLPPWPIESAPIDPTRTERAIASAASFGYQWLERQSFQLVF